MIPTNQAERTRAERRLVETVGVDVGAALEHVPGNDVSAAAAQEEAIERRRVRFGEVQNGGVLIGGVDARDPPVGLAVEAVGLGVDGEFVSEGNIGGRE